jgi:diketogulonate reductase-like aldo/keto reductase
MEEAVSKGLTRAIGVSNFTITKTEALLKTAKIVPAVNQVECHPYFQQKKLREYCDSKGILIEAYAPLGSPARRGVEATDPVVMDDPTIKEIASIKGATPAQICISFLLHRGFVVIPKSVTPHRIQENFEATKVSLTEEEVEALVAVDKNLRLFKNFTFFLPKGTTIDEVFDVEADEKFVFQK